MQCSHLEHRFVHHMPSELEPGVLYVSVEFHSVMHQCCCGCGREVVTPLTPTDWSMTFNGKTVSLQPSVGNWSFPCRSHYWIRSNRVFGAEPWSDDQVRQERTRDAAAKAAYFRESAVGTSEVTVVSAPTLDAQQEPDGRWSRFKSRLASWIDW